MNKRLSEEQLLQKSADAANQVEIGASYRHFKGGLYTVTSLVMQTVDDEVCVVYRAQYGAQITFARPLREWAEMVEVDNRPVSRFSIIKD